MSQQGVVYALGPHRVMCGDCRNPAVWKELLKGEKLNVLFTSPPYAKQRKYDESSGFVPIAPDAYVDWWEPVQANVAQYLAGDGSFFVNIKAHVDEGVRSLYVMDLVSAHVKSWGWRFVDELCWQRNTVPGKFADRFKNGWEPIFHFTKQKEIKFRPSSVAHKSKYAIEYSYDSAFSQSCPDTGYRCNDKDEKRAAEHEGMALPFNVIKASQDRAGDHSAPFPVALPEFFVKAFTDPGDLVGDCFLGSGTTLIAADRQERTCYGMELSPAYVDVIRRRWGDYCRAAGRDPGPDAL